jgi:hypothetical protein
MDRGYSTTTNGREIVTSALSLAVTRTGMMRQPLPSR